MEFKNGVPYCYNKLTKVDYYKYNKKVNDLYTSFVQYKSLIINKDRIKINSKIREIMYKKIIKDCKLGSGKIFLFKAKEYCEIIK